MKFFFLNSFFTILLIHTLNIEILGAPPIGKILSPFIGVWQNAEPLDHPLKGKAIESGSKPELET